MTDNTDGVGAVGLSLSHPNHKMKQCKTYSLVQEGVLGVRLFALLKRLLILLVVSTNLLSNSPDELLRDLIVL